MNAQIEIASPEATPSIVALVGRTGKELGQRFFFGAESLTAKDIKASLSSTGLKGAELKKRTNEALRNDAQRRRIALAIYLEQAQTQGLVPEYGDIKKTGGQIKFVPAGEPDAKGKAKKLAEENAALKAQLAALQAQLPAPVETVNA